MCLNYAYETVESGDYCLGTGINVSVLLGWINYTQQYNYGIPVCQVLSYLQRLSSGLREAAVTKFPHILEVYFVTGLNNVSV